MDATQTGFGTVPHASFDTPDRIRAAAIELFQRNGFHGTGIRELAQRAGLGAGALYHHIGSKEGLLFEISMELLRDVTATAQQLVAENAEPPDQLRAVATHLVTQHAARRDAWSVALRELRALTEAHRTEVIAARDAYERLWHSVFSAGAAQGCWRPVTSIELRGILGMFNSTARWIDRTGAESPKAVAQRYLDLILNGLRP